MFKQYIDTPVHLELLHQDLLHLTHRAQGSVVHGSGQRLVRAALNHSHRPHEGECHGGAERVRTLILQAVGAQEMVRLHTQFEQLVAEDYNLVIGFAIIPHDAELHLLTSIRLCKPLDSCSQLGL